VLLVEDEVEVLEVAARILEQRGYEVLEARDAEVALELARENGERIDVLVTDIVMPELGGVELARRLREKRPGLPVVYVSGYAFERLDVESMADNQALLQKPFTGETLTRAIGRVLARVGA
jgi:two-component system cell cycle sensor histidine kinase/response regulator CckA